MNILVLGPQGSGKGTQARQLAEEFKFFYFESGEFLRALASKNEVVRKILDKGELVDEKELASYIAAFFDEKQIYEGIIFDGFPRSSEEYSFLKSWLDERKVKIDLVFVLEIAEATTIKRLSARRQDPATGEIYNLVTDVPPAGVDTSKLIQREDDKPEAIKKRLEIYKKTTVPLINELKKETKVVEIDGEAAIESVQKKMQEEIQNAQN